MHVLRGLLRCDTNSICLCESPPFSVKSIPQGWDTNPISYSLSESPMSSVHSLWYWGMGPLSWCMISRTHKGTWLTGQSLTSILLQVGGERSCQSLWKHQGDEGLFLWEPWKCGNEMCILSMLAVSQGLYDLLGMCVCVKGAGGASLELSMQTACLLDAL